MANEILYSGHSGATRLAKAIHEAVGLLLDGVVDLRSVVRYRGNMAGLGSTVSKLAQVQLNDAMSAPSNEEDAVANTDFTTASKDVTIARNALRRQSSHLYAMTAAPGQLQLDPVAMAQDAYNAGMLAFASSVAALHASVSSSVGTSGVDLTVDTVYDAKFTLNLADAEMDGLTALFHNQQINDFVSSLRGEADIVMDPEGLDALRVKPIGFKFGWRGINFWQSNQVPTANAGADRDGCIFAPGAFSYADASPEALAAIPGIDIASLVAGVPIFTQFGNADDTALFSATYNWYYGVGEDEDARAVRVISDA